MIRLPRSTSAALLVALAYQSTALAQGYICAEGGGSARAGNWTPGVFGWMVEKGRCGRVVIIGSSLADPRLGDVFLANGAMSVHSLAITPANADSAATYDALRAADVVWILGGDQSRYVRGWKGTRTERAIREVFAAGGVIGGTSAGCAVLGDVIYDAFVDSLSPRQALHDAYHPNLTLTYDFLSLTPDVLFDTHFTERGRLGRLVVMLARAYAETARDVLGIGVDARTALCVSPDATAEVRGEGSVTILQRTPDTRQALEPGAAPLITNLRYTQLTEGYRYDLTRRQVIARPRAAVIVPPPTPGAALHAAEVAGGDAADAAKGGVQVLDGGDKSALLLGKLKLAEGAGLLGRTVVSTRTWDDTEQVENRVGGVQLALSRYPHWLGLYLTSRADVDVAPPALFSVRSATAQPLSVILLDTTGMVSTAASTYRSSERSAGPRQSVAIEGAMLHVLRAGWSYDANAHAAIPPTAP